MKDDTVAIVGGGCAGLSLACALVDGPTPPRRLVVIEPRERYEDDRTWGYWAVERHAFDHLVKHRWRSWSVRADGDDVPGSSARYPYCAISADAFYRDALARLEANERVEIALGRRATALVPEDDETVRIDTVGGRGDASVHASFHASWVFDSRPPRISDGLPAHPLLQHFAGHEVRTRRATFDPGCLTLMDFDVPQDEGIHFAYVLPFTETQALVEATFFSPELLPSARYEEAIERYMRERMGCGEYEVLRRERGCIPMAEVTARPGPDGTEGGPRARA